MKIAMVTPWFPNSVNPSSGVFVLKDVKALCDHGHDITVFHLVPPHEYSLEDGNDIDGIEIRRIPMSTSDPRSIYRASRLLRKEVNDFDVVHTQALSAIEPFVFSRPRVPWIHTEHWSGITTPDTLSRVQRTLVPLLLRLARRPDVVVSVCEFLARPLRAVRGTRPVIIIPCQVPSPVTLAPRPAYVEPMKLLSTGALVDRKDPLTAVRTLAVLKERGIRASLVWLGSGELKEAAEHLAAELGVDAQFPGTKSPAEVMEAFQQADMFFGPTKADNFFVAAAESLVNGRPLVVGANGGQVEYIQPHVGQAVAEQTPEAYADALVSVYERTRDLSAEDIAATVAGKFTPERIAKLYIALYKKLVGGLPRRSR